MSRILLIVAALATTASAMMNFGKKPVQAKLAPPPPPAPTGAEGFYGAIAPLGLFDPLGLATGKSEFEIKRFREAELKHGRLAMIAVLGVLVGENANPLFDGKITGPAIYQFQQADAIIPQFWTGVLFVIALIEAGNIQKGWESPDDIANRQARAGETSKGVAGLKKNYINGDLGFDPLGLKNKLDFEDMQVKELQNGRLAMIGAAGIVVQELVTGQGLFN